MARIETFRAFRYSEQAGPIRDLVTQPYDKITPDMQAEYLRRHPNNFVRIILGQQFPSDTEDNNVYTRAAGLLEEWIRTGVLVQDDAPSVYPYAQEFRLPESDETLTRFGLIALGPVVEYSDRIVYRHEQTLTGPKQDRLALIEQTRAHLEQLFLLYSDPDGLVDRLLEEVMKGPPLIQVLDEYDTLHSVWRCSNPERIATIQELMEEKKLLIADGHHRYETALAFRKAHPELKGARHAMMTFVNMHSPGLRILPTHRVIHGLPDFDPQALRERARKCFQLIRLDGLEELRRLWKVELRHRVRIGIVLDGGREVWLAEKPRAPKELDVTTLHRCLIEEALGISPEAVREQRNLRYIRGAGQAVEELRRGGQVAFLLEPCSIDQVAAVAFGCDVMPQKSTDFFPKLLSGLTLYRIEE